MAERGLSPFTMATMSKTSARMGIRIGMEGGGGGGGGDYGKRKNGQLKENSRLISFGKHTRTWFSLVLYMCSHHLTAVNLA